MKLTDEQIKKAAKIAYEIEPSPCGRWEDSSPLAKKIWIMKLRAAAPHLQVAPDPADGDLVEAALSKYLSSFDYVPLIETHEERLRCMAAAVRIVLDKSLAEPTAKEIALAQDRLQSIPIDQILRSLLFMRRANLTQKPELTLGDFIEQQVSEAGFTYTLKQVSANIIAEIERRKAAK